MKQLEEYTGLIILNYNNYQDTINCINSIDRYNTSPIKIIVVDNGSTQNGVVENLHVFFQNKYKENYDRLYDEKTNKNNLPYLTFDVSHINSGYAQGNNKGLYLAYNDHSIKYVMILNNDVLFKCDMIDGLINSCKSLDRCAVISPLLRRRDGVAIDTACARNLPTPNEIILRYITLNMRLPLLYSKYLGPSHNLLLKNPLLVNKEFLQVEVVSGSCFLIEKHLFQEMGGFDPHTFLYYEEYILSKQISRLGLKNYMVTRYDAIHLGGATASKYNAFCAKANLKSAEYYMYNYCTLSFIQRALFGIAVGLMRLKFYIYDRIHKYSK